MINESRTPVSEILVATDFSDASTGAVRVARAYARAFRARVHLLHVASAEEQGITALLAGLATTFAPLATLVRVVPGGNPAAAIVRYAGEHAIDLIVMGTHGRTGVSRVLLGSVAERVVRTAPCPVVTVAADVGLATAPAIPIVETEKRQCLVCSLPSEDMICEPCRAHIRGEALDQKHREERAGRR